MKPNIEFMQSVIENLPRLPDSMLEIKLHNARKLLEDNENEFMQKYYEEVVETCENVIVERKKKVEVA